MSIAAQAWLTQLPLDCGLNLAAFRVLHHLADGHNPETGSVWRSVDRLASELRCSKRTVQRALKDLELLGFTRRGDQRMLSHLDARYRPTVWMLSLELWAPAEVQPELPGVTTDVTPEHPVDNSGSGVTTDVTPRNPGVTDTPRSGVTTGVALGTVREPSRTSTSATTDRAIAECIDGTARHEFSRKAGRCVYCGLAGAA